MFLLNSCKIMICFQFMAAGAASFNPKKCPQSFSCYSLLFCPQVETELHKDHVVSQWLKQLSEKKKVKHECPNKCSRVKDVHIDDMSNTNYLLPPNMSA